ncbi:MAG TPA: SusD/RagB family nutrient-binding outer membrane lipoprotein [Bacteroidales bacterium]|nr:SusD/RagB family nutrient-binding outer membrane lipoprotein [Bacteroidales bacterium]
MKRYFFIIITVIFFWGCDDFLDVNTSLDNDERTTPNFMLPAVLGNMAYSLYSHGETTAYITQFVTTTFGTNAVKDRWDYRGVLRVNPWRRHYFDTGGNAHRMISFAESEGSQNYIGVGKIILAFSTLTATDLFGDMPVLQAFTGIHNPTYDPQDVVYAEVDRLLLEGIQALEMSRPTDRAMTQAEDHIFAGNINRWKAFAHAIRARMLLRTANFKTGYQAVLDAVDLARPNWAEPLYAFPDNPANAWEINPWGPSRTSPQWDFADIRNMLNNSVHTTFFMNAMNLSGQRDPRLYRLTTPGRNGNYASVPASTGIGALSIDDFAILYNGYWTSDNSPIIFITDEELYFIEAEAAFYLPNRERAFQAYLNGIRRNFNRLGVGQYFEAYKNSPAVAQSAQALRISDIMMQKYIALYLQPEVWSDMRRHGFSPSVFPGLQYPERALPEYNGQWIQRLPYDPQTEYIFNPREIARLGARDVRWIVTPFWWSANSTLSN